MARTVIKKAKELIQEVGEEGAIKYFQDKLDEMGEPKNFEDTCVQSGWEVAIEYIKGNIK